MRASASYLYAIIVCLFSFTTTEAALVLQLKASDYNPSIGQWLDSSGNSNHGLQVNLSLRPSLVTNQTSNGSAIVRFDGNDYLNLNFGIVSSNFTVFAFLRPAGALDDKRTLLGSDNINSFQYRIGGDTFGTTQQVLRQDQANMGHGLNQLSSTNFSNLNATSGSSGGSFRLNGAADGTSVAGSFGGAATTTVGTRFLGSSIEEFMGDVAEIRLYNTILTTTERQAIESQFIASYVTPVPEPSSLLFVGSLLTSAGFVQRMRKLKHIQF